MRIRLEGAAETLDKAIERYQWARKLLRDPWRSRAGRHLSALERMKNEEPLIEEALQKVERALEREAWGPESEPAELIDRLRRSRAELIAHLDPMLALATPLTETGRFSSAFATGRIQWILEYVIAEAVPPSAAEPLVRAPLAGLWRLATQLEVFPDRLRLRRTFRAPIEVRIPRGGIHYQPLEATLSIAGLGTLQLSAVEDAAAVATLIELFNHAPFDAIRGNTGHQAIVLEGSRTTGRSGALVLEGDRVIFLEDGDAAFEAAVGKTGTWASPKARLLARAVLAIAEPQRTAMFDRLLLSGAAQEVALKRDLIVQRGSLRVGDVKVDLPERLAREVKSWVR
ncbi:MAG: hypothetical protein QM723_38340 [Myxococcaceae bacterium]